MKIRLASIFLFFILCGCAEIITPTAHYAVTHPLSTKTMVSRGTGRDEVIEKWGKPNEIKKLGYDDMGLEKEAWTYNAWFPKAPLDYRHFSRNKKIYFTGGYVTGFEDIGEE
jgi:hypothetical protein